MERKVCDSMSILEVRQNRVGYWVVQTVCSRGPSHRCRTHPGWRYLVSQRYILQVSEILQTAAVETGHYGHIDADIASHRGTSVKHLSFTAAETKLLIEIILVLLYGCKSNTTSFQHIRLCKKLINIKSAGTYTTAELTIRGREKCVRAKPTMSSETQMLNDQPSSQTRM